MARNPLIRKKERSFSAPMKNQSAGILDDFAVRKVVHTKEGSIEQVPTNDNHITNKKYVDSNDFWNRVGTILSPKTSGDDITTTGNIEGIDGTFSGNVGVGTAPSSTKGINLVGNYDIGINLNNSITSTSGGSGINGFAVPSSLTYTGELEGLNFGVFSFLSSVSGNPTINGINVFGFGNYAGTQNVGIINSINIEGTRRVGGTVNALGYNGINIPDINEFDSLPYQNQLRIEKPTQGTTNKQILLEGNGAGSGVWFDSDERLYSDGTNLKTNCIFNPTGYKSSDGSNGSMTFKNGLLTAQTPAT